MKYKVKSAIPAVGAAIFLAMAMSLSSCGGNSDMSKTADIFYMDTIINTSFYGNSDMEDDEYGEINKACGEIIKSIESSISRTATDSQIYVLNQSSTTVIAADIAAMEVITAAFDISAMTGGAYNPTLGTVTDLWDIVGKIKSEADGTSPDSIPSDGEVSAALIHTGTDKFRIDKSNSIIEKRDGSAKMDLGGIGKGYAAQKVFEYLQSTPLEYGLVSMGGSVGVFGAKPNSELFKIGIRDPDDPDSVVGYLLIKSGFVSVSGDYERFIEISGVRYHHIFDPITGKPSDSGLRSVAVHSDDGMYADALSTALFVMGADAGMEFYRSGVCVFEAVFVTDAGELIITDGLRAGAAFTVAGDKYTLVNNK